MPSTISQSPPRVFSELKPWLQEHYVNLPKRLQSVAVFALHNPDVIALNTSAVISEKAGVTPSTLVRFAKSVGYQGFTDMQSVFQESMRHIPQPYAQRLSHLDDGEQQPEQTVLHRFSQAASASLSRLEQQADETAILQASEQLAKANTIYIAGQGRATPVTTYLHYTLVKMGIQAVLLDGMAASMIDKARLIRRDELLVAVSFSPYTANTRELVDICLSQKVPVVAITDSTLSPIARPDDFHLEVLEEEVGGIRGLSATMCLALCLAVETGKYRSQNGELFVQ
ncbi:MAG: MurR/RpiR family transcriptional regulator [Gammaproteobacteria bacterium]|nr:MurR/RpiR family transcriptional regulator [Gammaproteobacteria bacterium]